MNVGKTIHFTYVGSHGKVNCYVNPLFSPDSVDQLARKSTTLPIITKTRRHWKNSIIPILNQSSSDWKRRAITKLQAANSPFKL